MKEATGEVSMTVITLVAIGVIGAILAVFWDPLKTRIGTLVNGGVECPTGQYVKDGKCTKIG